MKRRTHLGVSFKQRATSRDFWMIGCIGIASAGEKRRRALQKTESRDVTFTLRHDSILRLSYLAAAVARERAERRWGLNNDY